MKVAPIRTMKEKRPFVKQRNMFGARIKIMWEEQLVDPPIYYKDYVGGATCWSSNWLYNVGRRCAAHTSCYWVLDSLCVTWQVFYLINDYGIFTAFYLKPFVMWYILFVMKFKFLSSTSDFNSFQNLPKPFYSKQVWYLSCAQFFGKLGFNVIKFRNWKLWKVIFINFKTDFFF